MKTTLWLAGLLALLPLAAPAQRSGPDRLPAVPRRLDSLHAWLRRPGVADTTRVKLQILCSQLFVGTRLDSARWYSEQAVALARRRRFAWGEGYGLLNLAAMQYYGSDYPAAQASFEGALRALGPGGKPDVVGHAYLGLGNVATELHNAAAAQRYFAQAQRLYARCRPRYVGGEQLVLHNRANGYLDAHAPALARPLVQQGLALLRRYPTAGRLAKFELLLGQVQDQEGHPDSAAATWQQAQRRARAARDVEAEGAAWQHLAALAQLQGRPVAALAHARQAAALFHRLGDPGQEAEALDIEAAALAALHRPDAYDTLRRYTTLRDTLLSQQRLEAVATAQARFERTEQQARIRALEQQRRIATLEAAQRSTRSRLLLAGAVAGSLLLGLGLLAAYRRRQRRRTAALRHQLAADLHDDVGSLLARIALQTDLLQEGLAAPGQQQAQWAEVAGNSRLAVRQLNDVVWSLDAANDTLPNLLDRLRDYAHEVLVPTGRQVRFVGTAAPAAAAPLPAPARRQLYLIFKEALHNILKYAPAQALVTVALHHEAGALRLDIHNTGPVPAGGRRSGHGLRNMQQRATTLGGTATAGPADDGGWAVRVRVSG